MTIIKQGNMLTGGVDRVETDPLRDRHLEPPMSVLRGHSDQWLRRKRLWKDRGIESDDGRDTEIFAGAGGDFIGDMAGQSIFDPVLCEILLEWYSPPDGIVFDPFAGGSVRGIVSSLKQRHYIGYDCRAEQIAANEKQRDIADAGYPPVWKHADSVNEPFPEFDMMLSCPPYGNLEVYSQQPDDISRLSIDYFMRDYKIVLKKAYQAAKYGSYAAFVVGNYRDKNAKRKSADMVDFVARNIVAFKEAGWTYFDDIKYLQPIGSAPQRAGYLFTRTNKVPKVHQDVLVFCKGTHKLLHKEENQ